jgi:hypothetical protein
MIFPTRIEQRPKIKRLIDLRADRSAAAQYEVIVNRAVIIRRMMSILATVSLQPTGVRCLMHCRQGILIGAQSVDLTPSTSSDRVERNRPLQLQFILCVKWFG